MPFNLPHEILRFLDRGVVGVTVPNVRTHADAEAAVRAARHYPFGERGHNAGGRPSRYGAEGLTTAQCSQRLNEQTLLIALIESKEGLDNAEAIANTPGVDAIDIGPSDLAQSLGLPPAAELDRAVDRIVEIAVAAGKPVGVGNAFSFANGPRMRDLYARGCRYFLGNTDALFRHGATAALDSCATPPPASQPLRDPKLPPDQPRQAIGDFRVPRHRRPPARPRHVRLLRQV